MRAHPQARFKAFDGLRAGAALLVVAYHVCLVSGWTRAGALAPLASALKGGVTVFFVISGFVLYLPSARAIRSGARLPDWREYARRRAVRILPAYWVALSVFALTPLGSGVLTPNAWRFYALAQVYNPDTLFGGLGVAWSLCVEISFYAALPLLARGLATLVKRRPGGDPARAQLGAIGLIALGTLALRGALAHSLLSPVPQGGLVLATALPGMLDWFAIGIALAVLAAEWELDPTRARALVALGSRPERCWLLATCCYTAGAALQHGDLFLPLYGLPTHIFFGLAAGLLVLPAVREPRTRGIGVLSARPMIWLGAVSYGIYLWHVPLLGAITGQSGAPGPPAAPLHVLWLLVVVALGATALAAVSWYVVERPAQRLARRRAPGVRQATAEGRLATGPDARPRQAAYDAH